MRSTTVTRDFHIKLGRHPNLEKHLGNLEQEFAGRSELGLLHAALIVLIRREVCLEIALTEFLSMWSRIAENLCKELDLRWLVSACDTFADHAQDEASRSRALLASAVANTVKLYETERRAINAPHLAREGAERMYASPQVVLFDGVTRYGVVRGDMIRNLLGRIDRLNADCSDSVQRLTVEVINRVLVNDTVFRRFAALHTNEATRWDIIRRT
ncbi:hypothetical protein ABGN05_22650 [Aquibium sp. LZ166]|uniref:RiboL-PSP-HEPN domain-containing protein n=1 Tax=Aquibium pacificus TaxID=3153579 RepID=A0ABV3SNU7_9HYPH